MKSVVNDSFGAARDDELAPQLKLLPFVLQEASTRNMKISLLHFKVEHVAKALRSLDKILHFFENGQTLSLRTLHITGPSFHKSEEALWICERTKRKLGLRA